MGLQAPPKEQIDLWHMVYPFSTAFCNCGYLILKVYKVYNFLEAQQRRGLFRDYVDT